MTDAARATPPAVGLNRALRADGVALRADKLIALRQAALRTDRDPALSPLPGGFATRRKGHGLEVADTRDYVPGDDIRHLDRGTTARTGRLHVRQFQQERDRVTLLVADFRPSMFWGLRRAFWSVAAAEALCMIGWHVVETGGRVGLLAVSAGEPVVLPPRGRSRGMLAVIGGMVRAHEAGLAAMQAGMTEDAPLDRALLRVERIAPSGSELVIASGFEDAGEALRDRLDMLSRRRAPRLLLVGDALAGRLPRGRYPVRLPDGRRMRVVAGGGTPGAATGLEDVLGRTALVLDAGDTVEAMARRVAGAFRSGRAA